MTFDSLSCSIPSAPQLDFDINKLRMLIADYVGIKPEKVTNETHFIDDLGLDWLDQVELMILIEDEFHAVEFSDADVKQIKIVGELIRHVERELYGKEAA